MPDKLPDPQSAPNAPDQDRRSGDPSRSWWPPQSLRARIVLVISLVSFVVFFEHVYLWNAQTKSRADIIGLYEMSRQEFIVSNELEFSVRRLVEAGRNMIFDLEGGGPGPEELPRWVPYVQSKHHYFNEGLDKLQSFAQAEYDQALMQRDPEALAESQAELDLIGVNIRGDYRALEAMFAQVFTAMAEDPERTLEYLNADKLEEHANDILRFLVAHRRESKDELEEGLSGVASELERSNRIALFVSAAILVSALLIGVVWGGRTARHLKRLAGKVERIGDGDLATRVSVEGVAEIAALARSINAMAQDLEDSHWRIQAEIAARKRTESSLREHQRRLGESSRIAMLGALAGGLAHELNQPLASVVNYTAACGRLLESGEADSERLRGIMEKAIRQSLRASEIVGRLRGYVENSIPERRAQRVESLLEEVVALAQQDLEEAKVSLALDLPSNVPPVWVDRVQVQQIMLNVINNAIEAMAENNGAARELTIQSRPAPGGMVEILFRDSAEASPSLELEAMFQPLVTRKHSGLGLGLSISRSSAAEHGGKLWATRNDGRGLTLHLTLQAKRNPADGTTKLLSARESRRAYRR